MENNSINRRDAIKKTAMVMGFALSASAIASVMKGCKADPNVVAEGLVNWSPDFLNKTEGQLVAQIAECIIPKTDTPGAIDTGVHSFIDIYLGNNTTSANQLKFKEGLATFEASCNKKYNKSFLEFNNDEKVAYLKNEEAGAKQKTKDKPEADTFWFSIKELTFLGYFTSEEGAKQFLKYDPIPGSYEACIPLDEVGGTWYTL